MLSITFRVLFRLVNVVVVHTSLLIRHTANDQGTRLFFLLTPEKGGATTTPPIIQAQEPPYKRRHGLAHVLLVQRPQGAHHALGMPKQCKYPGNPGPHDAPKHVQDDKGGHPQEQKHESDAKEKYR
eukprot:scaffold36827_cov176-Amphora_coffeaeformis.AAC.1